jgi:hypothetical protein
MSADRRRIWLFGISAIANWGAGALLYFRPPLVQGALGIPRLEGMAIVLADFCGLLVALFGFAYACVAYDPARFRPYIPLGIAGKLIAVALVWSASIRGTIGIAPSFLVAADLVFAALFVAYLLKPPARESQ